MIERPYYLDRLIRLQGCGFAKVLTGMRRTGKSGILRLLGQRLLEECASADQVVSLNLELMEHEDLRDAQALLDYVLGHATVGQTTFVLLDEAQEVPHVANVVYELLERGAFDLYLTGSHAHLLGDEFSQLLAGRYVEVPVHPLSFAEYRNHRRSAGNTDDDRLLFRSYLAHGGLPHALFVEDDPYALHEYLDGVYNTVVRRDVATGMGHEDPLLLDAIARQLMMGIGTSTTANGLAKTLASTGRSCTDDTVALYVGALTDAYAFHRVKRLDLRSDALLKTQEKFYVSDLGLRGALLGPSAANLAGMLENVVYLELRRRFDEVRLGKHYTRQISFVTRGDEGRQYFQVVPSVLDPATLQATLAPLRAERDNYPKTVLSLDEYGTGSHDGILHKNVVDWLLEA